MAGRHKESRRMSESDRNHPSSAVLYGLPCVVSLGGKRPRDRLIRVLGFEVNVGAIPLAFPESVQGKDVSGVYVGGEAGDVVGEG